MSGRTYTSSSHTHSENKHLYQQKERDIETDPEHNPSTGTYGESGGLDYFEARFYDSEIARFTTVDPHGNNYTHINGYASMNNNPINIIDPTGMDYVLGQSEAGEYEKADNKKKDSREEQYQYVMSRIRAEENKGYNYNTHDWIQGHTNHQHTTLQYPKADETKGSWLAAVLANMLLYGDAASIQYVNNLIKSKFKINDYRMKSKGQTHLTNELGRKGNIDLNFYMIIKGQVGYDQGPMVNDKTVDPFARIAITFIHELTHLPGKGQLLHGRGFDASSGSPSAYEAVRIFNLIDGKNSGDWFSNMGSRSGQRAQEIINNSFSVDINFLEKWVGM